MPRRILVGLAALCLLTFAAGAASAADGKKLLGVWKVTAMEKDGKRQAIPKGMSITIDFQQGGALAVVMEMGEQHEEEKGTWVAKGNVVEITVSGDVEKITYKITGKKLRLEKKEKKEVMHLTR